MNTTYFVDLLVSPRIHYQQDLQLPTGVPDKICIPEPNGVEITHTQVTHIPLDQLSGVTGITGVLKNETEITCKRVVIGIHIFLTH